MHWSQLTPSFDNLTQLDNTRQSILKSTGYILCSQRWRSSIQSAKARPGANCGSDHELLIAKFRVKLKKIGKTIRPFTYDLTQIPYDYNQNSPIKASTVMLKILQVRLQQYVNRELLNVQTGFRKGRGNRNQKATCVGSRKSKSFRKTSTSALLTTPKALTVWITTKENSSRDGNTRPSDLSPEKSVCRLRSNS